METKMLPSSKLILSSSRKHAYIILTPLNPTFIQKKKNNNNKKKTKKTRVYSGTPQCGSNEYPGVYSGIPQCGSNEYPPSIFLSRNMKNIRIFYLKIFIFWW